jgi:hypothetical protein
MEGEKMNIQNGKTQSAKSSQTKKTAKKKGCGCNKKTQR